MDLKTVFSDGATTFRQGVPAAALPAVLELYNSALRDIFYAAIVMCGLALLSTFGMEWNRNLLKKEGPADRLNDSVGQEERK